MRLERWAPDAGWQRSSDQTSESSTTVFQPWRLRGQGDSSLVDKRQSLTAIYASCCGSLAVVETYNLIACRCVCRQWRADPVAPRALPSMDTSGVVCQPGGAGESFGRAMLERMGWTAGTGLGARRNGMVDPLTVKSRVEKLGVGAQRDRPFADSWWDTMLADAYGATGAPTGDAALLAACEGRRCRPHGTAKLDRVAAADRALAGGEAGADGGAGIGEADAAARREERRRRRLEKEDRRKRRELRRIRKATKKSRHDGRERRRARKEKKAREKKRE